MAEIATDEQTGPSYDEAEQMGERRATERRVVLDRRCSQRDLAEAATLRSAAISALRHGDLESARELVRQADLIDPPKEQS